MEYSEINSFTLSGIEAHPIKIQAHINNGLPKFNIVGLGDKSVTEAKERVRSAFSSIGFALPANRITINLSPANMPKEGSHFDLPIAISLLAALNVIPKTITQNYLICGELGLAGQINKIPGILTAAIYCRDHNLKLICPSENYHEATLIKNVEIISTSNLLEILKHLKENIPTTTPINKEVIKKTKKDTRDFAKITGHFSAKRALEVAAAGKHNLLMIGPPGSGKSLLAETFPTILPNLTENEALETTMIYSISNNSSNIKLINTPPFFSPHHSASIASLAGGGKKVVPGAISLAHNGILFLDELPEFSSKAIEVLRQPLETGNINISRVEKHVCYPAKFQLIAAMNPCKCGKFLDKDRNCTLAPKCSTNYLAKISGPILDRIDIQIIVNQQNFALSDLKEKTENSNSVKERVIASRKKQQTRYKNKDFNYNSDIPLQEALLELADDKTKDLIEKISKKYDLSIRGTTKLIRVARTIADLDNDEKINKKHIYESLGYKIGSNNN